MCIDERIHSLDESMHLHVGYYEQGFDYEGVFFKSLETGRWLLFFERFLKENSIVEM